MSLTVLVPAHNEGTVPVPTRQGRRGYTAQLPETLASLAAQTQRPDRVVVIADNCTDDTVSWAHAAGASVFETVNNRDKKAGGLNQWLHRHLDSLADTDLVMIMDADSTLDADFVEKAMGYLERGYHAVGGVFLGKEGGGFVGTLQRNEYARYARDVARKNGRTLVLTGTATIFTASCLKDVVAHRAGGGLPGTGETAYVYDTKALTEDNELTYALLHLGYRVIAPAECRLQTDVMKSWRDLGRQRYRWKRGAVENNRHYGYTRYTAKYWFLQWWGVLGINATVLYLLTLAIGAATGSLSFHPVWIMITAVYVVERVITVARRGWRQALVASVILIEMPYDLFLQTVQIKALLGAAFRTKTAW